MSANGILEHKRAVHPTKVVWWEREKYADGQWAKTPHYGVAVESPKQTQRATYSRPVWALR